MIRPRVLDPPDTDYAGGARPLVFEGGA